MSKKGDDLESYWAEIRPRIPKEALDPVEPIGGVRQHKFPDIERRMAAVQQLVRSTVWVSLLDRDGREVTSRLEVQPHPGDTPIDVMVSLTMQPHVQITIANWAAWSDPIAMTPLWEGPVHLERTVMPGDIVNIDCNIRLNI